MKTQTMRPSDHHHIQIVQSKISNILAELFQKIRKYFINENGIYGTEILSPYTNCELSGMFYY